jgi:hypothetical protein
MSIEPEHIHAAAKKILAPKTFGAWLISTDPVVGWPVISWLSFTMLFGILLGVLL